MVMQAQADPRDSLLLDLHATSCLRRMVRVPEPLGLHTAPDVACSVLLGRAYLGLGQNNRVGACPCGL